MSRRWRYPRSRRGVFYGPPQSTAAPSAPSYVPAFQEPSGRNARLAAMRSRRGPFFTTARIDSPPARARRYAVRLASVRHGKFFSVPLVVAVASAPPWIPAPADPARRAPMRPTRRGRFYAVPLVGLAPTAPSWVPSPLDPARRVISRTTRRGKFYTVPPVGAAPAAAPWLPPALDPARRAPARPSRRGQFFTVPLVGVAPTAVPWVPPALDPARRPRLAAVRRGRFWVTPPRQSSWVPPITRSRRAPVRPTRRGEYLPVPVTRVSCPARMQSRRPRLAYCARGQMLWVPLVGAAPVGYSPLLDPVMHLRANHAGADPRLNGAAAGVRPSISAAAVRPNQAEATL